MILTGEKGLWAAVLHDAVLCAQRRHRARGVCEHCRALTWLSDLSTKWTGSYRFICETVGIPVRDRTKGIQKVHVYHYRRRGHGNGAGLRSLGRVAA
jgi:hypothetical protein